MHHKSPTRRLNFRVRCVLWATPVVCLVAGALVIDGASATASILRAPIAYDFTHHPLDSALLFFGRNPRPVTLRRPASDPLSAVAMLGKKLFFDPILSASGAQSCSSCHDPSRAFAPANALSVQAGGASGHLLGQRAVPSLMYLYRQTNFSIGVDNQENEDGSVAAAATQAAGKPVEQKTADGTAQSALAMVPQGGLFWDGRVNTLQDQALGPLVNPLEMGNANSDALAAKLLASPYRRELVELFGAGVLQNRELLVSEALFAIARYQIEDAVFHPFQSKFDHWLEGRAVLSPAERRGYLLFNDKTRANCAGCHLDRVSRDGLPPLFTDTQFEALAVPRNPAIPANQDPRFFDMGICGPARADLAAQKQFCGYFITPTLRNVTTRGSFFHNGRYHTLDEVMDFYDFRDTDPGRIYGLNKDGTAASYDDLPAEARANVDHIDAPLNRRQGATPAMTEAEMGDIVAFLGTLTDDNSH